MSGPEDEPRRVTHASGAEVHVLAFTPFAGVREGLHVCPACAAERVFPVDWEPGGSGRRAVLRRCPDCRWEGARRHDDAELGRFDEELGRAAARMVGALRDIAAERMAEDVERFLDALDRDLVLPEDF